MEGKEGRMEKKKGRTEEKLLTMMKEANYDQSIEVALNQIRALLSQGSVFGFGFGFLKL